MWKAGIFLSLAMATQMIPSCHQSRIEDDPFKKFSSLEEKQLTFDRKGHFMHTTQVFSPDDSWLVYDTRNKDSHIGRTGRIEMVHTRTGEIKVLYETTQQTVYGPGVGGASFSPADSMVLFIHGLKNCNQDHPYGYSRRTGVGIHLKRPGKPIFMDARDVIPPYTSGALRGGTHAHTWSGDGEWISFTYNDDVLAKLEKRGVEGKRDLRMVGIMAPYGPVKVSPDSLGEQIDGKMFSVVVSRLTENPKPGSDQIDRAYSDGWVGRSGYRRPDGTWQRRAVAFLGDTRDHQGHILSEVFLADIPDQVNKESADQPIAGTAFDRPFPPLGCIQKRLTFTGERSYPGVQGPRHWLRSAPDGSMIFFLMKDDQGIVQIYGVPPAGGDIKAITRNNFPVETTFSLSPDGSYIAYGYKQKIYLTHIPTGETQNITPNADPAMSGLKSICWSNDGKKLAFNRTVTEGDSSFIQVFIWQ